MYGCVSPRQKLSWGCCQVIRGKFLLQDEQSGQPAWQPVLIPGPVNSCMGKGMLHLVTSWQLATDLHVQLGVRLVWNASCFCCTVLLHLLWSDMNSSLNSCFKMLWQSSGFWVIKCFSRVLVSARSSFSTPSTLKKQARLDGLVTGLRGFTCLAKKEENTLFNELGYPDSEYAGFCF